jgi:hypothetical protein
MKANNIPVANPKMSVTASVIANFLRRARI